jgi:DNA ligase (NAD+)
MEAEAEEMERIFGIGPEVATSVETFFQEPRNRTMIIELLKAVVLPSQTRDLRNFVEKPLQGKSFVFTGTLSLPRSEAKARVERMGGRVSGSVSSRTDYVVVGDDPGSKRERASELGIRTISEDQFLELTE